MGDWIGEKGADRQTDTAGKRGTDRPRDRRWWAGGLDRERERGGGGGGGGQIDVDKDRDTDRHAGRSFLYLIYPVVWLTVGAPL